MIDRENWGRGPWDGEPDEHSWVYNDYRCIAARSLMGYWTAAVRVPGGHPLHGVEQIEGNECDIDELDVHRGVDFASQDSKGDFWIGFSCNHLYDYMPQVMASLREVQLPADNLLWGICPIENYRTLQYVMADCEALVDQLKELE